MKQGRNMAQRTLKVLSKNLQEKGGVVGASSDLPFTSPKNKINTAFTACLQSKGSWFESCPGETFLAVVNDAVQPTFGGGCHGG